MKLGIYYTLGDLGLAESVAILKGATKGGAVLLEVGLPFSDPLLDGPVIQQSHFRALSTQEIRWKNICDALKELTSIPGIQVSVMTSSQLLYDATRRAQLPKVDGLLVTDLPHSKKSPFPLPSPRVWFLSQDVVLGPKFSKPNEILSMVYLARLQGVTGAGQAAASTTAAALQKIRSVTNAPIWLGFGISTRDDLQEIKSMGADGAIVGSAFVKAVNEYAASLPKDLLATDRVHSLETFSEHWTRALLA